MSVTAKSGSCHTIPTSGDPTATSFCTQFEDLCSGEDNEWDRGEEKGKGSAGK